MDMLSEAKDHRPHLLHHRLAAIAAHIADADSAFARRGEIYIIRSRGGECDQLQTLCCKQAIAGQRGFIQQYDLSVVNTPGDLRVIRRAKKKQFRNYAGQA